MIADSQGFVWVAGEGAQDSILKFTRDGEFVWDFGHRPPKLGSEADEPHVAERQRTTRNVDAIVNKSGASSSTRWPTRSISSTRNAWSVFDASTGAFKRGWGGHGMALSEITNDPIPGYVWDGGPPPEERNFAPTLHFIEISRDRRVYIGERGQNRIQVFTTDGEWLQDIYVSAELACATRQTAADLNDDRPAAPVALGTFYYSICGTYVQDGYFEGSAAEVPLRRGRA